jgi:hypothetical protein
VAFAACAHIGHAVLKYEILFAPVKTLLGQTAASSAILLCAGKVRRSMLAKNTRGQDVPAKSLPAHLSFPLPFHNLKCGERIAATSRISPTSPRSLQKGTSG